MSRGMYPLLASVAIRAFMPATTSTVLASGCFWMPTRTAGAPLSRAHERSCPLVSRTVAMSRSGMRAPLPAVSSTPRMSSRLRNLPDVLPTSSRSEVVMRPAARSWFSFRSALMICDTDSPSPRTRSGSSSTWISRTRPPMMFTAATPSIDRSWGRSRWSTHWRRAIWSRSVDEKAIWKISCCDGSDLEMTGGSDSSGSRLRTRSTFFAASCSAKSTLVP